MRRFLKALGCALAGIGYGLKTQRHLRFHLAAATIAIVSGFAAGFVVWQWMVLTLAIVMVVAAELLNTAIEAVVDLVSPERHPLAKVAKDTAAAAVLVLAVAALVVGLLLFMPSLLSCLAFL